MPLDLRCVSIQYSVAVQLQLGLLDLHQARLNSALVHEQFLVFASDAVEARVRYRPESLYLRELAMMISLLELAQVDIHLHAVE